MHLLSMLSNNKIQYKSNIVRGFVLDTILKLFIIYFLLFPSIFRSKKHYFLLIQSFNWGKNKPEEEQSVNRSANRHLVSGNSFFFFAAVVVFVKPFAVALHE